MISPAKIYALSIAIGFVAAYFVCRKTQKFLWREYAIMFAGPVLGLAYLVVSWGSKPLFIFIIGAAGLTALEHLTGLAYRKIMGSRLWIYERFSFPGRYTSILGMPFWGFGAVIFWLISKHL